MMMVIIDNYLPCTHLAAVVDSPCLWGCICLVQNALMHAMMMIMIVMMMIIIILMMMIMINDDDGNDDNSDDDNDSNDDDDDIGADDCR